MADRACPACALAESNPLTGHYTSGCAVCEARQVSQAPKHLREMFYARILDPEERQAFIDAVGLEFKRRREMSC